MSVVMSPMDGHTLAEPQEVSRLGATLPPPSLAGASGALAVWPGAVIEYGPDGDVLAANDLGTHLVRTSAGNANSPLPGLVALVSQSGGSVCDRLEVTFDHARRWFECIALPRDGGGVLVLARDQTYDFNIRQALFDSRQPLSRPGHYFERLCVRNGPQRQVCFSSRRTARWDIRRKT